MKKISNLSLRIELETRQELDRLAKIEGLKVCELARQAIRLGMRDLNKIVRLKQKARLTGDRK